VPFPSLYHLWKILEKYERIRKMKHAPDIPDRVKIRGVSVPVEASGRGYVTVGETSCDMSDELKQRLEAMPTEDHYEPWQIEMYRLFEKALKNERKRLKGNSLTYVKRT
jgi:hypothetical protein